MTEPSLKKISESNLDLRCTQALKMSGSHLGNKIADLNFFSQKLSPLTRKRTQDTEDNIMNCFILMKKSIGKEVKEKGKK